MTRHTETAPKDELVALLGTIRAVGGFIMRSCTCPAGFSVTYFTYDH